MCWETGRNNLDNPQATSESQSQSQGLKLMDGVDSLVKCGNNDLSVDGNIVSLQGVKVPDENLTPQQRQHREEQLAKIKKMNQFLFPENDKLPNDSAMANIMMNLPGGGGPGGGGVTSNAQMQRQMQQMQQQMQQAQSDLDRLVQLVQLAAMPRTDQIHLVNETHNTIYIFNC